MQFLRARDSGDPYAFRFEPQDYILPTEGGDSPSARFDWTPALLSDLQAVRRPGREPAVVQRVGEALRRFVQDAGWASIEQEITQALDADRKVFVTVRSSAAELYALPWELLTRKSGQFLGEADKLLLRFEWPESKSAEERPRDRAEGGRILFAWSAAAGAVPAAEQLNAIEAACRAGFQSFQRGTDVLARASLARIVSVLEEAATSGPPIAVLHLLCHGGTVGSTFGLVLDSEGGGAGAVDAMELRQQLSPFAKMVRLVVLSACDSGNSGELGNQLGSVAQALHRAGFQSVIASRFPLTVAGAIALTETFYSTLLVEPTSLETAFLAARKRLQREVLKVPTAQRELDWASLQLYARHEDGDDNRPIVIRPFRGLLAFLPEHRRFFFGRDGEIEEVLRDLQALIEQKKVRFLFIAGASGTGKSSLVLARVVPEYTRRDGTIVKVIRPSAGGPAALEALLSARGEPPTPLLLLVDQFEEIFTTLSSAARTAFVQRLWTVAADPVSNMTVLVTLRVDFIGQCGEIVVNQAGLRLDKVAYDEAHRVFIAQLGPEQLRQAIEQPAARAGLELQPGLCDRLLLDVGTEPGALPLLEYTLDQLWQRREGRLLTQATYQQLGGVSGALEREADLALSAFDAAQRETARYLLSRLVAVGEDQALDTRQRRKLVELRPSDPDQAARFDGVLDKLVNLRLLVGGEAQNEPVVEVAHEALIRRWQTLRTWINEDREALRVLQALSHESRRWDAAGRVTEDLWRGRRLQRALILRDRQPLAPVEEAFLCASEEAAKQERLAELQRVQSLRDTDLRIGNRRRTQLETLLPIPWVVVWGWVLSRPNGVTHGRIAALLVLSLATLVPLVLANSRNELTNTQINRHRIYQGALLFLVLLAHHAMAAALGIPPRSALAVDTLLMSTLFIASTSWFWNKNKSLWLVGLPSLVAAAGATIWPSLTLAILLLLVPAQAIVFWIIVGNGRPEAKPEDGSGPWL